METLEFEPLAFDVDTQRRTITALVVPWNQVGRHNNGRRWRFARGSLKYGDVKYIRLHNDHDAAQFVGRAVAAEDTAEGLVMTFRVYAGRAGDRVLAMAKDGRKTGFSVEIEADDADISRDPENAGVQLVAMANLTGVGYVREPAFDDSRLISVMASREGGSMPCTRCGLVHAEGVTDCQTQAPAATPAAPPAPPASNSPAPQPLTFSADQLEWMRTHGVGIAPPAATPAPAPVTPPPARQVGTGRIEVTAPQNYRFDRDGNLQAAAHDFGVDLIKGIKYGPESDHYRRAMEFVQEQFAVVSTDVGALNPTIQMPRYIDQRSYQYPIWSAVNKGAPPNGIESFTWPKFNSASGLVGAHTEGVEPSSGSYTTTSQTVTPGAVSGKVKISREVWDMGGRPGFSNLIWARIERDWYEALEAKVVAVLDAATPTGITFTAGGGTTGQTLAAEMRKELTKLHYVRGGFRFDTAFSQIDLQLALTGALDSSARPIFPAIGPTNADGTVDGRYASVNVNGVPFIPAWALAATGTVAASSYLLDRLAVDAWATAPDRLDFTQAELANVYIGVWGYSAAAINDIAGVRELIYDPA